MLFLTLLLHGLPRIGYQAYRSALEPFLQYRKQETTDLIAFIMSSRSDKEVLAAIPVAAGGN